MDTRKRWLRIGVVVLVVLALYAPDVFALDQTQQRFNGILNAFRDQAASWQGTLLAAAKWVFFTLAIMQFAWSNMVLAMRGGDISEFISVNVTRLLMIGIMYAFLVHSYDWSHAVIKSFMQAGERAVAASAPGATAMDPANIFQNGMIVAGSLFSQMSVWSGLDNLSLVICALVIIICFAFLAAYMALVLVESYIVVGGTVLFLGFGGSDWTSEIAKRAIMYCVSVGAKLFVLQLVVGVAMGSVIQWAQTYQQSDSTSTLSLIGLVVLVTICAKSVPELVQGMLSGASVGGSGTMLATVGAAAAAVAAGGRALGAGGGGAGAGGAAAGGAAGGGAGGAGSGAAGAASNASANAEATRSSSLFQTSAGGAHLAQAAGHLMDMGAGVNPTAALGPLSSVGRSNDTSPAAPGPHPTPPDVPPQSGGPGGGSGGGGGSSGGGAGPSSGGDGGVIRGAGPGTSSGGGSAASAAGGARAGGSSASAGSGANGPSVTPQSASPSTSPSTGGVTAGSSRSIDERAEDGMQGSGSGDSSHLASSQLGPESGTSGAGPAPTASPGGGTTQTLDERAAMEPSGAGVGGPGLAETSLANAVTAPSSPAVSAEQASSSADRASSAADRASSAADRVESDSASRMAGAQRGALAGLVVGGPGGAAVGAAVGAVVGPHAATFTERAKERWDSAKARLGFTTDEKKPSD